MRKITRRELLGRMAAGGAVAAGALGGPARAQKTKRRLPNIVFILADDLGYGDLGCYGQKVIQTPEIDALAAEGMRFTDAYAGSTVCAPSRCCLMTGLHTGHAWVRGNGGIPLRPNDVTVAEVLQRAGYRTGLVGKWGLGREDSTGIPNAQGFDYFFGYLDQGRAHNYYPDYLWRNREKVTLDNELEAPRVAKVRKEYSHDLFTDEAMGFIDRNKDAPFFLYLAYTIPHANNERGRAKGDGMEIPDYGRYAEEDWPPSQKGHAAMITHMDRDIGRIKRRLQELGLDDDTIIFFTSDNGPHREGGARPEFFDSNGPLRGIKRDLYEGGVRVPMIVRWPGKVAPGTTSGLPCAFWDFLPTAAELAGEAAPPNLDGVSLTPTLLGTGERQARHDYLYWEFFEGGFKQAARMDQWKAVRPDTDAPVEIYDLEQDIGEENNVADTHDGLVTRAKALFDSARTTSPHWKTPEEKGG